MEENNQNLRDIKEAMKESDKKDILSAIEQGMILERLNNLIIDNKEAHSKILEQTSKTNGNVSEIQRWRDKMTGALVIMNIFFVPIILYLIYNQLKG